MGGKHLKRLRQEKSKVKLKKKKCLPKGANLTDTTFRVKKIVIVEQLRNIAENEPVSSWNIPLKGLLVRLNHYNYSSKLNSLTGIGEIIKNYPEILKGPSLRSVVTGVLELLTDVERKVRLKAISLLGNVFNYLDPTSIAPFQDILYVHLACAMTHRVVAIQQDSLKFIDVMIEFSPEALKRNFKTLIQNFVRILTSYKYGSHSELLLTKGSKKELEIARAEMLVRFYRTLCVLYSIPEVKSNCSNLPVKSSCGGFSLRRFHSQYKKIPDLSSLFKKFRKEGIGLNKLDSEEFKAQCSLIMPLLLETWSEFNPNHQNEGFISDFVLTEGAGSLLHIILKIIILLHEKATLMDDPQLMSWFISSYGLPFKKCFMENFPYFPSISVKKSEFPFNKELLIENQSAYTVQNLMLCHLFFCFEIKFKEQETIIEKYITSALAKHPRDVVGVISKIAEIVLNSGAYWKSDFFITTIVKAHNTTNNPELRQNLSKILLKLVIDNKLTMCKEDQALIQWMKSLLDGLRKPHVSLHTIEVILKLITQTAGDEVLKKELEVKAFDIIENLPHVTIDGINQFEGQKLITNILFWCNNSVIEGIRKMVLQESSYPQELKSYLIDILSYKLTDQGH